MNDRPRDDVIERVRKLLERQVGKGCTEAEAATAYAMASKLMAEHNLSMAEVEASQTTQTEAWVTEEVWSDNTKMSAVLMDTLNIVEKYFFVRALITRGRRHGKMFVTVQLFGKPTNIETARWVFSSLLGLYDGLWLKFRAQAGPGYGRGDKVTFTLGVIRGFGAKLTRERADLGQQRDAERSQAAGTTGTALATLDSAIQAAFSEAHPKLSAYKHQLDVGSRNESAFNAGFREGRNLNLARPVEKGGRANSKSLPGS